MPAPAGGAVMPGVVGRVEETVWLGGVVLAGVVEAVGVAGSAPPGVTVRGTSAPAGAGAVLRSSESF
ncbi:hypothetical protein ACFROC_21950, partial [Nocardia tengchongensis]|uniref:hypothetical protein n=1 Tax=Nocardia tengchongensis TaxID=2055889 RepID=UPI00368BEBC8